MRDTLLFLGRFHVLVLHLPLGILVATLALDWAASRPRYAHLRATLPFLWGAIAVSALATAVLGYLHLAEGGFDGSAASAHRLFGTAFAAFVTLVWWVAARRAALYGRVHFIAGIGALVLAVVTGHYGGNLTHGSTFLFGSAPDALGGFADADETGPGSTAVTGNAAAQSAADRAQLGATAGPDPAMLARLAEAGFLARRVAQSDPGLVVSVHSPGSALERVQLETLLAAAEHIVELDLNDADLEDTDLAGFERLSELTRLRLARNRLTDAAMDTVAALPKLESLNVYGNERITDAALERFVRAPALRIVHAWGTGITAEGRGRLHARDPELDVDLGAAEP